MLSLALAMTLAMPPLDEAPVRSNPELTPPPALASPLPSELFHQRLRLEGSRRSTQKEKVMLGWGIALTSMGAVSTFMGGVLFVLTLVTSSFGTADQVASALVTASGATSLGLGIWQMRASRRGVVEADAHNEALDRQIEEIDRTLRSLQGDPQPQVRAPRPAAQSLVTLASF
jgi:hypothetical protein